ncbi:MAG: Crp/Fnr family transcriptional regulator [Bacteroidales bacterium]|nr:Crp/Fnr family transcriptional regulator [Bacteroidales bacterium]
MKTSMKHPFNTYFEGMNPDLWYPIFKSHGSQRVYRKGECFCCEGAPAFYLGFIEAGYFKRVVRDFKGREQIIGFSFQNEFVGDYLSAVENEPARCEIIAVTQAKVMVCEGRVVQEVLANHPEAQREFSSRIIRQTHDRLIDLYKKSPKERYLDILKSCPEILQQVTLKELASYLQITPTYLSRIRTAMLTE